ncbi:MAG: hypothetical protein ACK50A_08425 [Sphingobacteriaceae bacterium]
MIKKIIAITILFSSGVLVAQDDSTHVKDYQKDTLSTKFNIPIFSTSGGDVDNDLEQQDVSSLLMSSRDVFTQFASFQFGAGRYRMRGYMAENQMVMINGVNVNNLETGFSAWSNWGGLNDVTRYVENRVGLVACRLGFSGAGGYTNIDSKASSFRKGTRVSYANANRIFAHRMMVTHSTGMTQNGWALTLSASSRYGDQVYIPGTYFNASAFYVSVDKRINDKHMLSFTGFGAPIEQGRASAATQESFDLAGSNYYNSLWGYQNGKVRNSQVSKVNRPMLMLSHIFKINTDEQLTTSVFYNFGKSSLSSLNWNDAPNPRPDYYRYLPSYYYMQGDTAQGDILKNNWMNDAPNTQQIYWDRLIAMNQANLYTDPTKLGQGLNTTETRARYILEDRIEDLKNIGFNTVYNKRVNELYISLGLNANMYKNRKYKELNDLLGSTFWLDVDQFAENLGVDESFQQNDLDNPNKRIYEGDKFGYDYSMNINRAEVWGQVEYSFSKMDVYASVSASENQIWREGFIANGKFPTTSKGNSEKLNFFNYGIKGGATYKINGRNFITANGSYLTRTPEANNLFLSPRVRNDIVQGIQNEKVLSGDINYMAKFPNFKFRATYYNTLIQDQTWLRTFWSDEFNNNVNYIMTDVHQTHQGIELGVEKVFLAAHTIQAALGYGQFLYKDRPVAQSWQDNNNKSLFTDRVVYLDNYHVGSGPQLVSGIGYRYNGKKFWFAGITFNYFDEIYLEPNPDRRTAEAISKYVETDPQVKEITSQEKLPSYYTLNINGGKSFRIMKKYFLNINLSVNNLLNNQTIKTSGFEQLRWDYSNVSKFDNKYYYMTGATYMAILNFNF